MRSALGSSWGPFTVFSAALLVVLALACEWSWALGTGSKPGAKSASAQQAVVASQHTNNWAIIACTSRYWLNYRHATNAMAIYYTVKRLGIPDTNIILMLPDDFACNPRNTLPGRMYPNDSHTLDVYGQGDVEVDYRGIEVTPEALLAVLTGRHDPAVPRSKRMLSDEGSNVLVYLTGHGGDGFLKFLDTRELLSQDLADGLAQAAAKRRYNEMLVIVETCQAATLLERITAPQVLTLASSLRDEQSLAYRIDFTLGISSLDRFTFQTLEALQDIDISTNYTLQELLKVYSYELMKSHFKFTSVGFDRPVSSVKLTDFFGGVAVPRQTASKVASFVGAHGNPSHAAAAGDDSAKGLHSSAQPQHHASAGNLQAGDPHDSRYQPTDQHQPGPAAAGGSTSSQERMPTVPLLAVQAQKAQQQVPAQVAVLAALVVAALVAALRGSTAVAA